MALIDKDQVKAELERLIGIHSTEVSDRVKRGVSPIDSENDTSMALIGQCHQLLSFLDTLPEQPASEDLEKEIADYIEGCLGGLEGQEIASCARYFYELGCRHTAVMYDDIEYERQRAEEAVLSGDLEEEVKRYWNEHALEYRIGRVADIDFLHLTARHFAEWGRKQVLQEIYDGKVKPVDKIIAAWLDDEQNT